MENATGTVPANSVWPMNTATDAAVAKIIDGLDRHVDDRYVDMQDLLQRLKQVLQHQQEAIEALTSSVLIAQRAIANLGSQLMSEHYR